MSTDLQKILKPKNPPRTFTLKELCVVFGVQGDTSKLEAFLKTLPRNMRADGNYTVGVFKRCVDAGFMVRPNWFVNNKAVHQYRVAWYCAVISQSGGVSEKDRLKAAGQSLLSYCMENGFTECAPWVVEDNEQRMETYAVIAWKPVGDEMYCITTNGFRTLDQNGKPVRW